MCSSKKQCACSSSKSKQVIINNSLSWYSHHRDLSADVAQGKDLPPSNAQSHPAPVIYDRPLSTSPRFGVSYMLKG